MAMADTWSELNIPNYTDLPNATYNLSTSTIHLRYSLAVTSLLCFAYTSISVVGVLGNYLVVSVYLRSKHMRSPMNILIVNLACADLLVNVLCLPFTLISNIVDAWILGWFICKTVPYLQGVSVSASVYTLVVITLERCLAICYPMTWQMTARICKRVVLIIWIFSLAITSPWVIYFQLLPIEEGSEVQVCTELWPNHSTGNAYFVVAHLLLCYLVPLTVISVCYQMIWRRVSRRTLLGEGHHVGGRLQHMIQLSKVKVVKMLLYVITVFAISWLPLYGIVCRLRFGGPFASQFEEDLVTGLVPFAQWLGSSNSCINPILYAFLNSKFRAGFKASIASHSCCGPLKYDYQGGTIRELTFGVRRKEVVLKKRMTISGSHLLDRTTFVTRTKSFNVNLTKFGDKVDGEEHLQMKLYGSLGEIGAKV